MEDKRIKEIQEYLDYHYDGDFKVFNYENKIVIERYTGEVDLIISLLEGKLLEDEIQVNTIGGNVLKEFIDGIVEVILNGWNEDAEKLKIYFKESEAQEEKLLKKIKTVKGLIKNTCYLIESQRQKVVNSQKNASMSEEKLNRKILELGRLENQLAEYEGEHAKVIDKKREEG